MKLNSTLLVCLTAATFAAPSFAQHLGRFTFNAGGGFTNPVQGVSNRLDMGWNADVGAGVNVVPRLGFLGEFGFNHLNLNDRALSIAGVPGGNMHVFSLTGEAIFRLAPRRRFDVYGIGGGGWYRRVIDFTAPTTALETFFDPFFGGFFNAAVPATQVLSSNTMDDPGVNIGAGITFRPSENSRAKFYAEARYHHIFTSGMKTDLLPVTFGIRW